MFEKKPFEAIWLDVVFAQIVGFVVHIFLVNNIITLIYIMHFSFAI